MSDVSRVEDGIWNVSGPAYLEPDAQDALDRILAENARLLALVEQQEKATLELVALTLARYGDAVNTKLSDVIPQATWDTLTERGLIYHARDFTGEGTCDATNEGADYLLALVAAISGGSDEHPDPNAVRSGSDE